MSVRMLTKDLYIPDLPPPPEPEDAEESEQEPAGVSS